MDYLSDVIVCCRELSSEKATERKKSLEKLKNLLHKKSVISSLDYNSQHGREKVRERNALTWDDIIREVHSYVYLETQLLQKGKEPQSATARSSRENKKREIGGVFKLVVKQAENRGPRLRASQLIKQITEVLRDEFMLLAYGLDYSSVLLKNVLTVRKYCSEIGEKTWHDLIALFCKLFGDPDCGLDKILLSRIVHSLISAAMVRCDLRPKKLLAFFTNVFKDIRNEKRFAVIEHLLSAVNTFVLSIVQNSRAQVCKFGESICINMLYLWENRPSNTLKEEILVFLRTQMVAHHPRGVRRDQIGSFAHDWDDWQSLLRKLYELFYTDLQQQNNRSRFSASSKDTNLPENYLELIVDICNQLFLENVSSIDVTQISTQQGPGTKKRRLESGWCYVLEFLSDREQHLQMIPWIQLVTRFLEKYPKNFPQEQVAPYLATIANQLGDFKRVEVIRHLMHCARSFIDALNMFPEVSEHGEILKKISLSALRCVSVHQAEDGAYRLLTSMAQQQLVIEQELWNLFLPSVTRPSSSAVQFLNSYLTLYKIPEHYKNHLTSLLAQSLEGEEKNYPLRKQLLDWVFPERSQCLNNSAGMASKQRAEPWEISHLVVLLLLKNQSDVSNRCCDFDKNGGDSYYTNLGQLFLQSSNEFEIEKDKLKVKPISLCSINGSLLNELYNSVLHLFKEKTTILDEVTDCDLNHLESLSRYICMIGNFIVWSVRYKVFHEGELTEGECVKCMKVLLRKFGRNVKLVVTQENCSSSFRILTNLQRTFQPDEKLDSDEEFSVALRLRSLVPACVIEEFMNVVVEKNKKANGNQSFAADKSHTIHGADDFDDFDMEDSAQNTEDQDDDFMDDGFAESQGSEATETHGHALKSILDESQLTEKQKLHLEIVRTLCFWCGFDSPDLKMKAGIEMDVDQSFIKSKLVKTLEFIESNRTFDLLKLKLVIKMLTSSYQHASEENLSSIVTALRVVAKAQRQDQEVCALCLESLCQLVPLLQSEDDMVTRCVSESRNDALILLSAFLNLPFDKCPEKMRLEMAKCMVQFLKADPDQNWAKVSMKGDDGTTEKVPVANEFIKYLGDLSHAVRMYCAKAVQGLFMCNNVPCERLTQDQCFDTIYSEIMDLLNLQDNLSAERALDERNNRVGSALTCLAYIVCASPVCEKKALFAFCQLTKARNVKTEKIKMILHKLAKVQGFDNEKSYIQTYLPYLIHQWLCLQYSMEEFPFQVAFCDSKHSFYREHYEILITELVMFKHIDTAKSVAASLDRDWLEVLKLCIPKIVVFILPQFAASRSGETSNDQVKKRTAQATACYDLLAEQATKEVVDKCIGSNLDVIVVNILLCLYDREEDEFIKTPIIRNLDPEPNPPCYNLYMTQTTLDYLTSSFSGNKSLVEVLSKTPDSLQKILEQLSLRLFTDHRLHEKRRVLLMYRLICRRMLRDLEGGLGVGFVFILREIIHRLVYLLQEMREEEGIRNEDRHANNISCMALELLHDVLKTAILINSKEVEKYLKFIISSLVPLTKLSPLLCEQVKNLLRMLIIDNKRGLKSAISLLDPFPDREEFQEFTAVYQKVRLANGPSTLCQIISNYLNEDEKMLSMEHSKEELHFLSQELASKTDEFSDLMESEQGKPGGLLSGLVMKLVKHSQMVKDTQALRAIGRCLGVVGPVDLMVLALPSHESQAGGATHRQLQVIERLDQYLIDRDMKTVQATSQVLKTMFSSSLGNELRTLDKADIFQGLQPFFPKRKGNAVNGELPKTSYEEFAGAINKDGLWWDSTESHSAWLGQLTSALLTSGSVTNPLLYCLKPVCLLKTKFCEFLLPQLIHDILSLKSAGYQEILSSQISKFFLQHCRLSPTKSQHGESSICLNKESIKTMLGVIDYLRQQTRAQQGRKPLTVWDNNFWLDVNYLHIAKASLYCSAHFSTVLYAEIWCNCHRQQQEETPKRSSRLYEAVSQSFTQDSQVDSLSSDCEGVSLNVQDILLEAYRQIGDPDGVYGCGAGRLADPVSRIRMYEHEGQWEKAVITYDIGLEQHAAEQEVDLLKALDSFGSHHLLDNYLENYPKSKTGEIRNLVFMSAIKIGKWDLAIEESPSCSECRFSEAMYRSLNSLKDSQFSLVSSSLDIARKDAIGRLQEASIESCRCLYPILSDLKCVSQIEQALSTLTSSESRSIEDILKAWTQEKLFSNDFEYLEPIYNIRVSVLQVLHNQTDSVQTCMQRELLELSRLAVQNNRYLVAERVVSKLKSLETLDFNLQVDKLTEEANLFWARGEQNIAKHMMKKLLKMLEQKQDSNIEAAKLYPRVLSMFGNWLAETHSENPNIIMEDYLEKTVTLLESLDEEGDIILDAHLSLARFADGQYQHIVNYMKSSTFEAKQNLMLKAKREMMRMQQLGKEELERDRYFRTLSKQSEIDQSELDAMGEDRERYLRQAVQNYIKCLKHGDKHDIRLFRLVSLWFSNPTSADISGLIMINIENIKSYKFLSLIYQLCARMDTNPPADQTPSLQKALTKIIHRTAVDHPHHALFCIFALANAKRDSELLKKSTTSKSWLTKGVQGNQTENEGRIEAAKTLINQLKKERRISGLVNNMETLCDAYIQLANYNVSHYKNETKPINLDKRLWIMQRKETENIAVPTDNFPIDPSGDYKSIVTLKGFEPTFKLAGGINLPKILTCLGSDGRKRRQLVKGRDDLRQDAIMQQVFEMLNTLLHKNPGTRKRNLSVRQYKVIPLSQCSGVLEWCEGTLPIGMYLIGEKDEALGAHKRFRPQDITARTCRDKMVETARKPLKDKLQNFLEVCSKFQPVMRYFFMENFAQPSVWFERRLAYIKSVSTTSIVGYILGLGDRHIQNILIDTNTAELVHIDLGIAFEQGRILPTPETVPFRLTRDVIDGMGVSGVEGTFRRCCEKTMEVMHNHQEALLTILEVLLYDPLNNWTISPQKAAALQGRRDRMDTETSELNVTMDIENANASAQDSQESVNKLAERVLLRLQQKLQGYEEGVQLSVTGQVNNLIQEARDPKNLCKLFPGWQPYI